MEKVVLICGSDRENDNTAQIIEECARIIEENGVKTDTIFLYDKEIKDCQACVQCSPEGKCVIEDDFNSIMEMIRDASGLIIGTHVLGGYARGNIISLLQRLGMVSKATDHFLSQKIGGPITVSGRGGSGGNYNEMVIFYLTNEMIVVGSTSTTTVFGTMPGDVWKDPEGIMIIQKFAKNVAWLIKKISD